MYSVNMKDQKKWGAKVKITRHNIRSVPQTAIHSDKGKRLHTHEPKRQNSVF